MRPTARVFGFLSWSIRKAVGALSVSAFLAGSASPLAASADDRLRSEYVHYILVKRCFDVRRGFELVYVPERDMTLARLAVVELEKNLRSPDADIGALWREANRTADGYVPIEADIAACGDVFDNFRNAFRPIFNQLSPARRDF